MQPGRALRALCLGYAVTGDRLGSGSSLLALGVGGLALLSGAAGVASRLVTALAVVLGWPSRRFGGSAGALASENAVRNPSMTAATAAALMIGLALVSFVAVFGKGVHDSRNNAIRSQVVSPWVVTSQPPRIAELLGGVVIGQDTFDARSRGRRTATRCLPGARRRPASRTRSQRFRTRRRRRRRSS